MSSSGRERSDRFGADPWMVRQFSSTSDPAPVSFLPVQQCSSAARMRTIPLLARAETDQGGGWPVAGQHPLEVALLNAADG